MNLEDTDNIKSHNYDSSGWQHLVSRFGDIARQKRELQKIFREAKIGLDLGSGLGNSALALTKLCPVLREIHCVDNQIPLSDDLKIAMGITVTEHRDTIQGFVAQAASMDFQADIVMAASLKEQPFFKTENLEHLAASIKRGGALLIYYPQQPFEYNQAPLSEYFSPLFSTQGIEIWVKN